MGGASGCRIKTPRDRQALSGGANPGTATRQAGLAPSGGRNTAGTNGTWVPSGRKAGKAFREGKPPKGESHERCRCETKPARDSREQAVKRVAKP
jgi:hypothetical protein